MNSVTRRRCVSNVPASKVISEDPTSSSKTGILRGIHKREYNEKIHRDDEHTQRDLNSGTQSQPLILCIPTFRVARDI